MRVIMVVVSSVNGKLTRDKEPNIYSWTSKEDSKLFFSMIEEHNLIVMGSKTYKAAKNVIKLKQDKLRIVLTRNPVKYKDFAKSGQLEFSDESPHNLINRLERLGYKKMLLIGGGEINSLFLKESLVDELYLTIEPFIFGKGKNLVSEVDLTTSLKLLDIKKLNANGTLHLRYRIERSKAKSVH